MLRDVVTDHWLHEGQRPSRLHAVYRSVPAYWSPRLLWSLEAASAPQWPHCQVQGCQIVLSGGSGFALIQLTVGGLTPVP